jgi:hypothetical protein
MSPFSQRLAHPQRIAAIPPLAQPPWPKPPQAAEEKKKNGKGIK